MEQDLKPTPICDYAGFERLMEQGNANKIVAATKMNATSRLTVKLLILP
jgi:hypothetical protein